MSERLDIRSRTVLAGVCLTVLFTALEIRTPVVSLGPVSFTTSEVAAGILIAASLVFALANLSWYLSRRALDLAVLLFLAANFLSTAFAAEDKPSAFKFSLRMTYAALVYLAVSRLPARSQGHLWVAGAAAVTLVIVTVVGLMENFISFVKWPDVLEPFNEGVITFGTFYNIRVASTLPYPTVLSMYLELMMPLALMFGLWCVGREKSNVRRRREAAVLLLVAAVMVVQVFTFTRSALVATPLSLIAGAWMAVAFGYRRRIFGFLVLAAVLLAVTLGVSVLLSNKVASRLDITESEPLYGAEYTLLDFPSQIPLDSIGTARINIRNTGSIDWSSDENEGVLIGYRWVSYPGMELYDVPEYIISSPTAVVPPGGDLVFQTDFATPRDNGRYVLVFELAKTHIGWFSSAGPAPLIMPLEFIDGKSRPFAISETADSFKAGDPAAETASRSMLWPAGLKTLRANLLLGVGPDQFRKRYAEYAPEIPREERLRTHNILLEPTATTGIVGLAAMLFLLARMVQVQFRLTRNRSQSGGARLVSLALFIISVAYITHGMLDYFLWQTGVAFMFFIVLGLTSWLDRAAEYSTSENSCRGFQHRQSLLRRLLPGKP